MFKKIVESIFKPKTAPAPVTPPLPPAQLQTPAPVPMPSDGELLKKSVDPTPTRLIVSDNGLKMIKQHEGCKLKAYLDGGGVWTIGYGHTETAKPGMVISQAEAERLFIEDVQTFADGVRQLIKVPVTQNQFDALVSLAYNIGLEALRTSTLLKNLNRRDYVSAAENFLSWKYDNKKFVQGLLNRRVEERKLFLA
jgi:lysozyme